MEAEAAREHERLTLARRLMPGHPSGIGLVQGIEHHALVTFSKRRRIRCRLTSRPLVVVRVALVDSNGQPVAYHLTPVQFTIEPPTARSFQLLERLSRQLPQDSHYDDWLASSLWIHSAFWNARLARELSIADLQRSLTPGELQPGLFDWRAEQGWSDEQQQRFDWIRESTWFTKWASRQATLETEPPHIALALFTR
jgi:hypothetical protein